MGRQLVTSTGESPGNRGREGTTSGVGRGPRRAFRACRFCGRTGRVPDPTLLSAKRDEAEHWGRNARLSKMLYKCLVNNMGLVTWTLLITLGSTVSEGRGWEFLPEVWLGGWGRGKARERKVERKSTLCLALNPCTWHYYNHTSMRMRRLRLGTGRLRPRGGIPGFQEGPRFHPEWPPHRASHPKLSPSPPLLPCTLFL